MLGPLIFIIKTTDPIQLDYTNYKAKVRTFQVYEFSFPNNLTGMVQFSFLPIKQVQIVVIVCSFLSLNLAAIL